VLQFPKVVHHLQGSTMHAIAATFMAKNEFYLCCNPTERHTSIQTDWKQVLNTALAFHPHNVLRLFGLVTGFLQASAQMPPRGIYSDGAIPALSDLMN